MYKHHHYGKHHLDAPSKQPVQYMQTVKTGATEVANVYNYIYTYIYIYSVKKKSAC